MIAKPPAIFLKKKFQRCLFDPENAKVKIHFLAIFWFSLLFLHGCAVSPSNGQSSYRQQAQQEQQEPFPDSFADQDKVFTIEEVDGRIGYYKLDEGVYLAQYSLHSASNEQMKMQMVYPYLFNSAARLSVREGYEVFKLTEVVDVSRTYAVLIVMYKDKDSLPWEETMTPWFYAKDYKDGYSVPRSAGPNDA